MFTPFHLGWNLIILAVIWTGIWKGLALWKAARRNDVAWFVVMLIVNTLGLIEILYYFLAVSDKKCICGCDENCECHEKHKL